jgi:hypothetical protein
MSSVDPIDKKKSVSKPFTFFRDELLDINQDFIEILQSTEAIHKEWANLDGHSGNGIVSIAEMELWLCIRFPLLRNSIAIRMSFYRTLYLSSSKNGFIQKQAMRSLLIVIFCANQALRWWNELPSKSADTVLAWISSKKIKTLDERVSLENSREQLSPNQILQNLQSRVAAASESKSMFCIDFESFCDLMTSFKTTPIDIMYCNLSPNPIEPLSLAPKPRSLSEIQKRIRNKILKATREQDLLSATTLPYMKSNQSHQQTYSSRPSTSHLRPSTSQSVMDSKNFLEVASRPSSRESAPLCSALPIHSVDAQASHGTRPQTSSESVFSLLTGRGNRSSSLEACESAGEVLPGIIFTKNAELFEARRSYLKAFGLQHPHTGSYFHSLQHNDLLSENQIKAMHARTIPDFAARLNDSPLKNATFQLLRDRSGKNPLAFSTERSPCNGADSNQTLYPRRPWNCKFASSSSLNGSFSLTSTEVQAAKNHSPITRALSPTCAKLLSPTTSSKSSNQRVCSKSENRIRQISDWDSSRSPLGYFETKPSRSSASFAKTEWV